MKNIYDCVNAFKSLLNIEYKVILGRKSKLVKLHIVFDKTDCFHLMGLQYLKDRPNLKTSRGKIFNQIESRTIKKEYIESSDFYSKIYSRIELLPMLENILDSNRTVFKYNGNKYSKIEADYLLTNDIMKETVFVFLSENKDDKYFCRSFFPQEGMDYAKGQTSWTMLYKSKINKLTGKTEVLYDSGKLDDDEKL